ncbi:MAG: FtsX-like permease family protein [Myxococcota bacterium]
MLTTLTLAARNLGRNLRRTLITIAAITFGLMTIHFVITLQNGAYEEMLDQGVSSLAGHVVVQADGYQAERDAELLVTHADDVAATLSEAFPSATIAPRILLGGLVTSPTNSVPAGFSGVDPVAEGTVQSLDDRIVAGTWLDDDDRGILIGADMAESLDVGIGDKIVFMGQFGDNDDVSSRLFRVKGIFRTGAAEMDGMLTMGHLAAGRDLLGAGDVAHQVTVHLEDPRGWAEATALAQGDLGARGDLEVLAWRDAIPELYGLIQLDQQSGDTMLVILGLIVTMGVLNTVLMSALERTREFGVMMALGLKPRRLASLILAEGFVLGVVGSLCGLLVGLAVSYPLVVYGLDYSSLLGSDAIETGGVAISAQLMGKYSFVRMASYTLGAVALTTLAAAYPAWHVARLEPVAAMRHV